MRVLTKTLLATLLATGTSGAFAAAFQLNEVSTVGLGQAYAGDAALADNASAVTTNPALMSLFQRPEISVGGIYVKPKIDIAKGTFLGQPTSEQKNIAPSEFIPHFYALYPINSKFAVGGGINANYGLSTKYDKTYEAGIFAGSTKLTAVNFNLSGSYRLTNNLSVGVGINAIHAKANIERYVGMLGATKQVPAATKFKSLDGKAWGYGWNVGAVYEFNQDNRLAITYRSHTDIDFKGNYYDAQPVLKQALPKQGDGSLTLTLPAYWEVAGYNRVLPDLAVTYSVKRTLWHRFKELRAVAENNGGYTPLEKPEHFHDTTRIALGLNYDVNEKLTLRTGIAYDEVAVDAPYQSLSIPDTDRTWYSVGATYRVTPNLSVDAGYAYIKGKKVTFTESQGPFKGTFTSTSRADLFGLSLNYRF
ncbi:hypothetical protein CEP45_01130 [Mergibacter septicus]|uniref:porin n=1 Tax=Mergibacter septicus TaxID=221402 RepID=UPI001C767D40|nr:porin [Mergibacter septicus]QDJ12524.1 hypothetical protein CEP45_01130 [Mergibacter septicus]